MSNELIKSMPMPEMMSMAQMFVDSKMFDGINQVAMAFVKIQAGAEMGIAPFASMSGIHIIKGKVSIGAGLMAGCVKGNGKYDYKVMKLDEKICSIDFLQAGKVIGNSSFTIDEAKKAGTQNLEKFPRNMLFARAMSNGVKWFCPDVFTMPVYTPEEMGDPNFTEDISHENLPTPLNVPLVKVEVKMSDEEKQREINSYTAKLANCSDVEELKTLKSITPKWILTTKEFSNAATLRFTEVSVKKEAVTA